MNIKGRFDFPRISFAKEISSSFVQVLFKLSVSPKNLIEQEIQQLSIDLVIMSKYQKFVRREKRKTRHCVLVDRLVITTNSRYSKENQRSCWTSIQHQSSNINLCSSPSIRRINCRSRKRFQWNDLFFFLFQIDFFRHSRQTICHQTIGIFNQRYGKYRRTNGSC